MMDVLNIVGSVSNAIAAIAAVVAIIVTIRHYKSDKKEQRKERVTEKKGILFKESVIDSCLEKISKDISLINQELASLSKGKVVSPEALQSLYHNMRSTSQNWLYEMEIIKVFNDKLYNEVKVDIEKIVDKYSLIISMAVMQGEISENATVKINSRLMIMRKRIYKKYLTLV